MYRQEKSFLTNQVEGRLSAHLSNIDNCEEFTSNSLTKIEETIQWSEHIHSLLEHIRTNCITDNKNLLSNNDLIIDKESEMNTQYSLTWSPIKDTKTISGFIKIKFLLPEINLYKLSNFKSDNIQSLTNLIIDLMTLTFAKKNNDYEKTLIIVKTKGIESINNENVQLLKSELETYCGYNKSDPTFLYIKDRDTIGRFHKHYSNYE